MAPLLIAGVAALGAYALTRPAAASASSTSTTPAQAAAGASTLPAGDLPAQNVLAGGPVNPQGGQVYDPNLGGSDPGVNYLPPEVTTQGWY